MHDSNLVAGAGAPRPNQNQAWSISPLSPRGGRGAGRLAELAAKGFAPPL